MSGALTFAPPRCVVTLPYPDRRLSINGGRLHPALRARLRDEAKEAAGWAAKAAIPADARPVYPAGVPLLVVVTMERPRRGRRWDTAGVIEALKPQADALNGIAWADDQQIVGWIVLWDTQPTHAACIHLAVYACMEIATWPRPVSTASSPHDSTPSAPRGGSRKRPPPRGAASITRSSPASNRGGAA